MLVDRPPHWLLVSSGCAPENGGRWFSGPLGSDSEETTSSRSSEDDLEEGIDPFEGDYEADFVQTQEQYTEVDYEDSFGEWDIHDDGIDSVDR